MIRNRFAAGLILLATSWTVACSSDDNSGPATSTPSTTRITAAAGGTVTDPRRNTSLVIPPGALAKDTDITLTILPKSGNAVVEISEFGPDGLTFLKPATLSIKAAASLAPVGQSLILGVKEGGEFKALPGSSYANGVGTGPLTHFSQYSFFLGGGSGSDGGVDSGVDGGGGGAPAPGSATMEATLSDPVNNYNGTDVSAFHGLEAESNAEATTKGVGFDTSTANGVPLRRGLFIHVPGVPVEGMTYTVANNPISNNYARFQENHGLTAKVWSCPGPVTFDSITGKLYKFHYVLRCTNPGIGGAGTGGITVTGTGVGMLK
jgi:hypothetical protein